MEHSPSIDSLSEDAAAARLRAHDILPTQQRLDIARVLFTRDQHVSADQVMELVNRGSARVSKATVYNTLGLFAEKGLLREVHVDPSRAFYDTNRGNHHHFYNVDTGELSDIPSGQLPVDQLPAPPPGTELDGVDIIIRVRNGELPEA